MRKPRAHPILFIGLALISALVPVLSLVPAQALAPAASRSVLFGGTLPLLGVQSKVGHLGIVRMYYSLGEKFGSHATDAILRSGTTALISLDDPPHGGPSYNSIAAGKHDTEIRAFLTSIEQAAVRYRLPAVYVTFEHEANSPAHRLLGTPAQFAAAYRHIHDLAAHARLNWNAGGRLHWALILEHMAYFPAHGRPPWAMRLGFAADYWPGRAVDVVASDGYNTGLCYKSRHLNYRQSGHAMVTPGSMFNPMLAFARAHGHLPVIIAEWASIPYTSAAVRPEYIRSMQAYVLANPVIKAAMYWDSQGGGHHGHGGPGSAACSFTVNHDPQSMAALAAMNRALRGSPGHAAAAPPASTARKPAPAPAHRTRPAAKAPAAKVTRPLWQPSWAAAEGVA